MYPLLEKLSKLIPLIGLVSSLKIINMEFEEKNSNGIKELHELLLKTIEKVSDTHDSKKKSFTSSTKGSCNNINYRYNDEQ